jgi:hypothetical protein
VKSRSRRETLHLAIQIEQKLDNGTIVMVLLSVKWTEREVTNVSIFRALEVANQTGLPNPWTLKDIFVVSAST